ncbi:VWA domain-containing protein [Streptosporangium sp. NPDC051022]|uniref:VWA domain-containing protein n=1 Tax=Streptosporangium sp. NPDC051022 TaxID=3155752 RepID=UPI0034337192
MREVTRAPEATGRRRVPKTAGHRLPRRLAAVVCGLLLGTTAACSAGEPTPTRLSVLASSDLADIRPLLGDLRRETGVELEMDYRGTVQANDALNPGYYRHDVAWLSSDRYLRLKLKASGFEGEQPLSTETMFSPVVIGLRRATAERLRRAAGTSRLSWADIADGAARGLVRFGMADPRTDGEGLAALVGVATAAAGTGGVLRLQDVSCDRLRGFFSGQTLTAPTSGELVEKFVAAQDGADGLIGHESALLSLNASGRLREPLEIVYPQDGIVMSDYPILLLNPDKRDAYDKVVSWLKSAPVQRRIMERTLRRPLDPEVPRDPRLNTPVGNALYFPDQKKVVDKLLDNYDAPGDGTPDHVLFVLDFSTSMKGPRIAALRAAFAGLGGADDSSTGKFVRFHRGEVATVIRFGGHVLGERSFTVGQDGSMNDLHAFVAGGGFDNSTAIWSALDHAYRRAAELVTDDPRRRVSIVLMTDGENNAGVDAGAFLRRRRPSSVHAYAIRFGDASLSELSRVATATGGRAVDATSRSSLLDAFKEIRGCR